MSRHSLAQSLMADLEIDNVVVRYVVNFVCLAAVGMILSQWENLRTKLIELWEKFTNRSVIRPELIFSAKEVNTSWSSGLQASNEFKAWLTNIRAVLQDALDADADEDGTTARLAAAKKSKAQKEADAADDDDEEATKGVGGLRNRKDNKKNSKGKAKAPAPFSAATTAAAKAAAAKGKKEPLSAEERKQRKAWRRLLQLKEFRERQSYYDSSDDKAKETRWMPNQDDPFQVTDKIFCKFHIQIQDEEGGDNNAAKRAKQKDYMLTVYVENLKDQHILMAYHDNLMKEFYAKAELTLSSQPHIFELKGGGGDDDGEGGGSDISWNQYPFSSTRQLEHVWFKDKDTFVDAYEYFLNERGEYERRGDPYTFNALLFGLPGCGKTSLIKALVNDALRRDSMLHVFVISFAKIQSSEMFARVIFDPQVAGHKIPLSQRMLIFEDFDASGSAHVFKRRDKKDISDLYMEQMLSKMSSRRSSTGGSEAGSEKGDDKDDDASGAVQGPSLKKVTEKISLTDILNILDGINERTGMRAFWTTNVYPPQEHFDPAFLRPGRMDMLIEFTRATDEGVRYLVGQYYDVDLPPSRLPADGSVDEKWTPAEIKQLCKQHRNVDDCIRDIINKQPTNTRASMAPSEVGSDAGSVRGGRSLRDVVCEENIEIDISDKDLGKK